MNKKHGFQWGSMYKYFFSPIFTSGLNTTKACLWELQFQIAFYSLKNRLQSTSYQTSASQHPAVGIKKNWWLLSGVRIRASLIHFHLPSSCTMQSKRNVPQSLATLQLLTFWESCPRILCSTVKDSGCGGVTSLITDPLLSTPNNVATPSNCLCSPVRCVCL